MNWEEKFKEYRDKSPEQMYEEKYGPIVGPWLLEYENRDTDGQASWRAKIGYELLQEAFGEVPQWIQEDYIKGKNFTKDYILENLQSHNWEGMMQDIEKKFPADKRSEAYPDHGPLSRVCYWPRTGYGEVNGWISGKNIAEIENIAAFYGYTLTTVRKNLLGIPYMLTFEPDKSESATEYLHKKCNSWGYTIVPKISSDSVEKNGLRCRNGNREEMRSLNTNEPYKKFPKRIYFCAFPEEQGPPLEALQDVCDELGRDWNSVDVYRINFHKMQGVPIYRDPAMNSTYTFFMYHNVPPEYLQKVHDGSDRD